MNKFVIIVLCFTGILLGCRNLQSNFDVKVVIINEAKVVYDSVSIYVFPDRKAMFYNVRPKDTLIKIFKYRDFNYPKGEYNAAGIGAYKNDYYYGCSASLIDSPYALLDEQYNFYIWNDGITQSKDMQPKGESAQKMKISEIPK